MISRKSFHFWPLRIDKGSFRSLRVMWKCFIFAKNIKKYFSFRPSILYYYEVSIFAFLAINFLNKWRWSQRVISNSLSVMWLWTLRNPLLALSFVGTGPKADFRIVWRWTVQFGGRFNSRLDHAINNFGEKFGRTKSETASICPISWAICHMRHMITSSIFLTGPKIGPLRSFWPSTITFVCPISR